MENDRDYNILQKNTDDNIRFIYSVFAMAVDLCSHFIRQSSVQLKLYWEIVAISIFNYKIKTTSFPSKWFLIATAEADFNLWITTYSLKYVLHIERLIMSPSKTQMYILHSVNYI